VLAQESALLWTELPCPSCSSTLGSTFFFVAPRESSGLPTQQSLVIIVWVAVVPESDSPIGWPRIHSRIRESQEEKKESERKQGLESLAGGATAASR